MIFIKYFNGKYRFFLRHFWRSESYQGFQIRELGSRTINLFLESRNRDYIGKKIVIFSVRP